MSLRKFIPVLLGLAFLGCGAQTAKDAKRTLTGISQQQVLVSAQHTLAQKGLDVEKISFNGGEITSAWSGKPRRQLQYKVTVAPSSEAGGDGVETLVIAVSASAREKVVGGWSEPAEASSNDCDDLLDDIVDLAVERFGNGGTGAIAAASPSSGPQCSDSSECPDGAHCGSGRCVSECSGNGDCEKGGVCDSKGRCVKPESAPCPEVSSSSSEEDDGKEKKKKRRNSDD